MSGKKSDESDVKLSFEDAVKQLEAIIERIEGGDRSGGFAQRV